jgi:hypothetical protein
MDEEAAFVMTGKCQDRGIYIGRESVASDQVGIKLFGV